MPDRIETMDAGASVKALRCLARAHWAQNRPQGALAVREVMPDRPISLGSLGAALKPQAGLNGCAWPFDRAVAAVMVSTPVTLSTQYGGWPGGE